MPRAMNKSLGAKTLIYPAPVLVVGTYGKDGKPNVMTASWGGICCSQPPCVAISLRRATYSHGNILERQAFTLSIPSERHVKQADYFGLVSGRNTDKFAATRLTPVRSKLVDAPYVKEFPLVLECKLVHVAELGLHTQFVGEVIDAKADESIIGDGGAVDIRKLKPLIFTPDTQDYYGVGGYKGKVFSAGKDI
jgi:flavin reductase (DIM6/NTAB) family NADH-FMN oxidoreductase RutF